MVSSCGTPTRPTAPPGRAMPIPVRIASSRPTHSSTEWTPKPSVSSRTRCTASSAALADDVGGAELTRERDPVGVPTEDDDLVGPEPPGRDHAAQADGPVADHGHTLAVIDAGDNRRVMSRGHHVRERQQRRQQRVVLADRQGHERPVGQRHPDRLGLGAVDRARPEDPSVDARRLQPFAAELARPIGIGEGHDNEVADVQGADVGADRLHYADGLVSHPPPGVVLPGGPVRPQIAAADRGAANDDEGVGLLDEAGVGNILDADVPRAVKDGCAHAPHGSTRARVTESPCSALASPRQRA